MSWFSWIINAITVFLAAIIVVALLAVVVFACDTDFLQEPTTREPDIVESNTVIGFVYKTYSFIDGRTLTVIYQRRDFLSDLEPFPLFYVVTGKDHTSIVYIDIEGQGHCYEIRRYQ